MHTLNESNHNTHPSWHPNAFFDDYAQGEINCIKKILYPFPLSIQQIANYLLYMSLALMDVIGINIDCIQNHQVSYVMHFLYCRTIWLDIAIFLCLWNVKKTWQKQTCIKIKDPT
jgi:hypothetical protein